MFFDLTEAEGVKNSDALLEFIEELKTFFKEKGGDFEILDSVYPQITFKDNSFYFKLSASIPLRK